MKKYYWLVENRRGDNFETRLSAKTDADAIKEATTMFNSLSKFDKMHTAAADIMRGVNPYDDADWIADVLLCIETMPEE